MSATQYTKISDFCDTGSGTTPSRQKAERYYGGNIPWVKSGELREDEITKTEESVTDAALKETSLKIVPAGALLVAMYGATVGRVGRLGIEATTNQAICHIVPDPSLADERYMFHALCAKASELVSKSVGGAQPNISQGTIKETTVYLPPLDEQKRIAAILGQSDELRHKRQRAIARLSQLGQAIFHEMFESELSGQDRIPLSELVEEFRYGTSNKSSEKGYPTLRIPNVVRGTIDSTDLKMVPLVNAEFERLKLVDGDVLFVRTNGNPNYVGRSAVFTLAQANLAGAQSSDWAYASYLIRARLTRDLLNPWFLQAYLSHPQGKKALRERSKTSAGQFNINTEGLGSIPIPNVPLAKQISFASTLERMEPTMLPLLVAAKRTETLFQSLQHRAFQGEL